MADFPFDPNNARVEELKIFEFCLNGFLDSLRSVSSGYGGTAWNVVQTAGPQHFRELFREKSEVKLPFICVIVSAMRETDDPAYNKQALYDGIYMGTTTDNMQVILHLNQIAVDVQVLVVSQTLSDITDFAQRWLFKERTSQFALTTDTYNIAIKVKFNPELTIPEEEFGDMGNLFNFSLTGTFYPYIGVMETKPTIKSIKVITDGVNSSNDTTFTVGSQVILPRIKPANS